MSETLRLGNMLNELHKAYVSGNESEFYGTGYVVGEIIDDVAALRSRLARCEAALEVIRDRNCMCSDLRTCEKCEPCIARAALADQQPQKESE